VQATSQTSELLERSARDETPVTAVSLVLSAAELAECTCPEWCERDHDRD
jgi:hypothetical protein